MNRLFCAESFSRQEVVVLRRRFGAENFWRRDVLAPKYFAAGYYLRILHRKTYLQYHVEIQQNNENIFIHLWKSKLCSMNFNVTTKIINVHHVRCDSIQYTIQQAGRQPRKQWTFARAFQRQTVSTTKPISA